MLGNLHQYDHSRHAIPVGEMLEVDRYIIALLADHLGSAS